MQDSEKTVDEQQLRQLLKNLINSSFDQEKAMQTLKGMSPSDPGYIPLAQNQKSIKDNLKTAEDSLYALSRRIPQIQSTVNQEVAAINSHIDDALSNLGDRRTAEATRNQQFAMTSMNNLALMLSEALDQLQKSKSKGKSGKGKATAVYCTIGKNAGAAKPKHAKGPASKCSSRETREKAKAEIMVRMEILANN